MAPRKTSPVQDAAAAGDTKYCSASCKFGGKEKTDGIDLTLIRCCTCMKWYHEECCPAGDHEATGIWNCLVCRASPLLIQQLMCAVESVRHELQHLTNEQRKSDEILRQMAKECTTLKEQNAELRLQVEALSRDPCNPRPNEQTLVVGDSLLRDMDADKLNSTTVISKPGGKVKDAIQILKDARGPFKEIIACVGTNDCSSDGFDANELRSQYQELAKCAKSMVSDGKQVTLSSIPPRTDSSEYQANVETMNSQLSALSTDEGVTFAQNDINFKLYDGSINSGHLLSDGLHLNRRGSIKLAQNIKLSIKESANGDPTKKSRLKRKPNSSNASANPSTTAADTEWTIVGPARRRPQSDSYKWQVERNNRREQYLHSVPNEQSRFRCWFCGETNHSHENCWHGDVIQCQTCGGSGHKSKFCHQTDAHHADTRHQTPASNVSDRRMSDARR